jgi:PPOX class probable F420-dependent enzyme
MSNGDKLTPAVRAFLSEVRFAVLATINADGTPQQTVMWYDLQGDEIMMNTTSGRVKQGNTARDPRVSVCFEEGYKFVTICGHVREAISEPERAVGDILHLAQRYNPGAPVEQFDYFRSQPRETLLIAIDKIITNGFES